MITRLIRVVMEDNQEITDVKIKTRKVPAGKIKEHFSSELIDVIGDCEVCDRFRNGCSELGNTCTDWEIYPGE